MENSYSFDEIIEIMIAREKAYAERLYIGFSGFMFAPYIPLMRTPDITIIEEEKIDIVRNGARYSTRTINKSFYTTCSIV